jgi:serine/threonine-protein kinase
MEYVDGLSTSRVLRELTRRGARLPLEISVKVLSQACDGLAYAHDFKDSDGRPLNLVHRDVNPQNILISYDGDVKLIDFGIAKAAANLYLSSKNTLKGKAAYMAPEQIVSSSQVDRRADVFSLGIVLYEFLTGHRPFQGEAPMELMNSIINETFPDPRRYNPEIPVELVQAIFRCLEKNPDRRFSTAGELHDILERLLVDKQVLVDRNMISAHLAGLIPPGGTAEGPTGPRAHPVAAVAQTSGAAPDVPAPVWEGEDTEEQTDEVTVRNRPPAALDERARENALRSRPTLYMEQVEAQPQPTVHDMPAAADPKAPAPGPAPVLETASDQEETQRVEPVADLPKAPRESTARTRDRVSDKPRRRWGLTLLIIVLAFVAFTMLGFVIRPWIEPLLRSILR